jgi:hypothetical protein
MFNVEIVTRHVERASEAMQWGVDDCCQFVRNVVIDHGGPDLMMGIPPYKTEKQGKALLKRKRGVLRMVMNQADRLRFPQVERPFTNDKMLVGIVPTKHGPALSFRLNGGWIVRAEHGVTIHNDDLCVIAWEVQNA